MPVIGGGGGGEGKEWCQRGGGGMYKKRLQDKRKITIFGFIIKVKICKQFRHLQILLFPFNRLLFRIICLLNKSNNGCDNIQVDYMYRGCSIEG